MTNLRGRLLVVSAFLVSMCSLAVKGQTQNADTWDFPGLDQQNYRDNLNIPELDGYVTLKCDFHMHTVYSDGQLWPVMRVNEAWNQGLDAIAITDHIEVRPNENLFGSNLNKPNELARKRGEQIGLLVVNGTEITRSKPLGHLNALFVTNVNALHVEEPLDAVNEANRQGAFVFWNHPGWPDKDATMYPVHKELIAQHKIRGAEVFNSSEHYPKVLDYCRDNDLAFMANSDLHVSAPSAFRQKLKRPMTLVFARERSLEGIREALFAGRTVAYFGNHLAGKEEYIKGIINKSLSVKVLDRKKGLVEICNKSDLEYGIRFRKLMYAVPLYANQTLRINLDSGTDVIFTNCLIGQNKNVVMRLW